MLALVCLLVKHPSFVRGKESGQGDSRHSAGPGLITLMAQTGSSVGASEKQKGLLGCKRAGGKYAPRGELRIAMLE